MARAEQLSRWHSPTEVWLDHATLTEADLAWLAPARAVTLWAVTLPSGLLAALPQLVFLDLRGGSGQDLEAVRGCSRLRYLQVNQVRGTADLSVLPTLTTLELLSLYGLPRVRALPSLAALRRLRRVQLGSMKGLAGLTGLLDAPTLEELLLSRRVGVAEDDAQRLADHPTLTDFDWFSEDVPLGLVVPFRDTVHKRTARTLQPQEWFAARGGI